MMLIDNRNILRIKNRALLESLSQLEESGADETIVVEPSRRDVPTLKMVIDGKQQYIHSKYDPQAEAERLVNQIDNLANYDHVLFIGTGLGYHIEAMLKEHPTMKFSIFEPNETVLLHYVSHQLLHEKNLQVLITSDSEQTLQRATSQLVKTVGNNIYVFTLPSYKKMYAQQEQEILKALKETLKDKRSNIVTNAAFQKRWTINSIKNFPKVLSTPNILHDVDRTAFQGKPAIIVAAGPSLNEEFENLRYIKENGLAYIFSVGSAINALIEHGIYPDAACTYDPQSHNERVIKIIKEKNIKEIPLVFGSSVGYETLENYPGKMLHMITSQDTIAPLLLDTSKEIDIVYDAPSIAVITYQMLSKLGSNPIILVGQNLSFQENKRYARGIKYENTLNELTKEQQRNLIPIKDVQGNDIYTDDGYNRMREQLEMYISSTPHIEVINTTKKGANIEGSVYRELEQVIKNRLKESQVKYKWNDCKPSYSHDYSSKQLKRILLEEKKCDQLLKKVYKQLNQIERSVNQHQTEILEQRFVRFDKEFNNLKDNPFYIGFIEPMVRVQNERLSEQTQSFRYERDLLKKGQKVVSAFQTFLDVCSEHIHFVRPLLHELEENIHEVISAKQD